MMEDMCERSGGICPQHVVRLTVCIKMPKLPMNHMFDRNHFATIALNLHLQQQI